MSKQIWDAQHGKYAQAEWIDKPSLFSQQAVNYFPRTGALLDMGCGQGQDSRFFSEKGYAVTGIDFSKEGIGFAQKKSFGSGILFREADISEPLPFEDGSFDVAYSHLALHYFSKEKTKSINKRYFSTESLKEYVRGFEAILVDDAGETYKDRAVGTSNLVRFIGRKP